MYIITLCSPVCTEYSQPGASQLCPYLDGRQTQLGDLVSALPLLPQLTLDVLEPLAAQVAALLPLPGAI